MIHFRKHHQVLQGDCLKLLKQLPSNSIDAVVTDPPYGLSFMQKDWDTFKSRDHFTAWMQKNQEQILRVLKPGGYQLAFAGSRTYHWMAYAIEDSGFEIDDQLDWFYATGVPRGLNIARAMKKAGLSHLAPRWAGWNTTLRPMHEPGVLAQKPLSERRVADNIARWGVGALNVQGCAVGNRVVKRSATGAPKAVRGKWPGNIVIEDGAAALLDAQMDRFYYSPKPTRSEREQGCAALPKKFGTDVHGASTDALLRQSALAGVTASSRRNHHPTVKPVDLMRWLVRLLTPLGGLVLDPFCGSGSTGIACVHEGMRFLGMEKEGEFVNIARARIGYAAQQKKVLGDGFFKT